MNDGDADEYLAKMFLLGKMEFDKKLNLKRKFPNLSSALGKAVNCHTPHKYQVQKPNLTSNLEASRRQEDQNRRSRRQTKYEDFVTKLVLRFLEVTLEYYKGPLHTIVSLCLLNPSEEGHPQSLLISPYTHLPPSAINHRSS